MRDGEGNEVTHALHLVDRGHGVRQPVVTIRQYYFQTRLVQAIIMPKCEGKGTCTEYSTPRLTMLRQVDHVSVEAAPLTHLSMWLMVGVLPRPTTRSISSCMARWASGLEASQYTAHQSVEEVVSLPARNSSRMFAFR